MPGSAVHGPQINASLDLLLELPEPILLLLIGRSTETLIPNRFPCLHTLLSSFDALVNLGAGIPSEQPCGNPGAIAAPSRNRLADSPSPAAEAAKSAFADLIVLGILNH